MRWLLPEKTTVQAPDGQGYLEPVEVDAITLSGYTDTPEGRATAEWNVFLDGYDTMAAAQDADRNPGQLDSKYALYQVYNREMADKLDEIVEKYGLILHTEIIDALKTCAPSLPARMTSMVSSLTTTSIRTV